MGHTPLKVQMFGDFTLGCGTEILLSGYTRKNKPLYLLQYFLVHREQSIPRNALIEMFYDSAESVENPSNALKLIIHRLRKLLVESGLPDLEYIVHKDGTYRWNNDIPCEIDAEYFRDSTKAAGLKGLPAKERIRHYEQAVSLYKGGFLPGLSSEDWVIPLALQYQEQCLSCIKELWNLLDGAGEIAEMLRISSNAASLFPYEEEVQILRIKSLYKARHLKEALAAYESVVNMLYDEFGVDPSRELLEIYQQMISDLKETTVSMKEVKDFIKEADQENGAYYCNLQNFVDAYHIAIRSSERTGMTYFLMLLTLEEKKGFHRLQEAIKTVLRRSDFFARYSQKQYLVLLMGISQEDCALVFRRIEDKFRGGRRGKETPLSYKVVSANEVNLV